MLYSGANKISLTNKALEKMDYHGMSEQDILMTFNYPTRYKKAKWGYSYGLWQNERDVGEWTYCIVYRQNGDAHNWLVVTCWRMSYTAKGLFHSIRWWFAHVLG